MAPLYRCAWLQQRFGATLALDLPALAIERGGIHLLLGENGSGKSTLLSILAFLARPTQGQVWFEGEPVGWGRAELLRLRRRVTLVHQFPYLFSGSVADNLAIGLRHRGVPAGDVAARVGEALDRVALGPLALREARTLSGGEARRMALARAVLLDPAVLLLDEPFANLDAASAVVFDDILAQVTRAGATVVLSSHQSEHVERHRGNVIRLREGRLAAGDAERASAARP